MLHLSRYAFLSVPISCHSPRLSSVLKSWPLKCFPFLKCDHLKMLWKWDSTKCNLLGIQYNSLEIHPSCLFLFLRSKILRNRTSSPACSSVSQGLVKARPRWLTFIGWEKTRCSPPGLFFQSWRQNLLTFLLHLSKFSLAVSCTLSRAYSDAYYRGNRKRIYAILFTPEYSWLQSMGSQRVRHDWATEHQQQVHTRRPSNIYTKTSQYKIFISLCYY